MPQFLEEYLVKLGFDTNHDSLEKFKSTLDDAENTVTAHTGGMVRKVLEAQGAIVGAFTSISAAILGTVDRVAMADQSYRLMGLRMMMTTQSARELDMITKTLGASLEEIMYDKELHERANMLDKDYQRMSKNLGSGFEGSMKSVRDFRIEFGRLEMGVQFLAMQFSQDLWTAINPGDKGKNFHDWITDMENRIPEFSKDLTKYAIPALKDTWTILKELGEVAQTTAMVFTNVVGILSGDKSIEGAAFSFDKVATAIQHVGEWMVQLERWIAKAEIALTHFALGVAQVFEKNYSGAINEWYTALDQFKNPKSLPSGGMIETAATGTDGYFDAVKKNRSRMLQDMIQSEYGKDDQRENVINAAGKFDNQSVGKIVATEAKTAIVGGIHDWIDEQMGSGFGDLWNSIWGIGFKETNPPPSSLHGQPHAFSNIPTDKPVRDSSAANTTSQTSNLLEALTTAIEKYEAGTRANPRSERNNNPGNLRTWGSFPVEGGYVKFPDKETGENALREQIAKNIARGLTLEEFFGGKQGVYGGFAPAKDNNNPEKYAATVAKEIGVDPNVPLNKVSPAEANKAIPSIPVMRPEIFVLPDANDRRKPSAASPQGNPQSVVQPHASLTGPIWMYPPADEKTSGSSVIPQYGQPAQTAASMTDKDWASAFAHTQQPIAPPQPNVSHVSKTVTVDVGGIFITEPGATAEQIGRIVGEKISAHMFDSIQNELVQLTPAFG